MKKRRKRQLLTLRGVVTRLPPGTPLVTLKGPWVPPTRRKRQPSKVKIFVLDKVNELEKNGEPLNAGSLRALAVEKYGEKLAPTERTIFRWLSDRRSNYAS
jgi:hypothetical protein